MSFKKTRDSAARKRGRPLRHIERDLLTSFNEFGLAAPITRALAEENYVTPTPIQAQTIPLALQGRDVIGIGRQGFHTG